MKVQITYYKETPSIKIIEIRNIDDDWYPRVIGKLMREINDKRCTLIDLRQIDEKGDDS